MIGLLLDSLSDNTGDRAICEVMIAFLSGQSCEFDVISPLGYDRRLYDRLIIGGGHLIRPPGDQYYDAFRVPGEHILNTVGVSDSENLDYLRSYLYVSVRSHADYTRLCQTVPSAAVVPCVSLLLEPDSSSGLAPNGAIGFHFDPNTWATIGDISLFAHFREYRQVLVPVMHYTDERSLLERIACLSATPLFLLPILPPRRLLFEIGRLRAFVTTSLHGTIFAYLQNTPFLSLGTSEKIMAFLRDRGLSRYTFRSASELKDKLGQILNSPPDFSSLLIEDLKTLNEHFACLKDLLPRTQVTTPSLCRPGFPAARDYMLIKHNHLLGNLTAKLSAEARRMDLMQVNIEQLQRNISLLQKSASRTSAGPHEGHAEPVDDEKIAVLGRVESTNDSAVVHDSLELSGWAIAKDGVCQIRVLIDGILVGLADERYERLDVARLYPGYPEHPYAGWRAKIDTRFLTPGWHETIVQVATASGAVFEIARLPIIKSMGKSATESQEELRKHLPNQHSPNTLSHAFSGLKAEVLELSRGYNGLVEQLARLTAENERLRDELGWLTSSVRRINQESNVHATLLSETRSTLIHLQEEHDRLRERTENIALSLSMASSQVHAHDQMLQRLCAKTMEILQEVQPFATSGRSLQPEETIDNLPSLISNLITQQAALRQELSIFKESLRAFQDQPLWRRVISMLEFRSKLKTLLNIVPKNRSNSDPVHTAAPTPADLFSSSADDSELLLNIESPLPSCISSISEASFALHGWAYHPSEKITHLCVQLGSELRPADIYGIVRPDVYATYHNKNALRSGFFSSVHIDVRHRPEKLDIALVATTKRGRTIRKHIGTLRIQDSILPPAVQGRTHAHLESPLVAICMATHNPRPDLFAKQIESIKNQTYKHWIVVISDDCSEQQNFAQMLAVINGDERFIIARSETRLGFYRNFERSLSLVPEDAAFIALSDQDDWWHPRKIQLLLDAFKPDVSLVYSDVRLTNDAGDVLSKTYWIGRRNNYRNLASLILANTVSGATTLFPRRLLDLTLPFPRLPGEPFHDHWIACVARSVGTLSYIGIPLNDYVQHGDNVIGHSCKSHPSFLKNIFGILGGAAAIAELNAQWSSIYYGDLLRLVALSSAILQRCRAHLSPSAKRTLRLFHRLNNSWFSALWLLVRSLRQLIFTNETLWAETRVLRGFLWSRLVCIAVRTGVYPLIARLGRPASGDQSRTVKAQIESKLQILEQKTAPLRLQVVASGPRFVNVLIPTVDFRYFFGGYISKLHFSKRLAERGHNVRLVIVDYCNFDPDSWRGQLSSYEGLSGLVDAVKWHYAFDRNLPLTVGDRDVFVATTWWTAHIAHAAMRAIGGGKFIYLIQEFEPFTFPNGSFSCLAEQSYRLPHFAVFSTEYLRNYFRKHKLGVFSAGDGDATSVVFRNAISRVEKFQLERARERRSRKLLFYGRFEEHAARNMAEVGFLALKKAIEWGGFGKDWQFHAIGSTSGSFSLPLGGGFNLDVFHRMGQNEYAKLLQEYDLGLALMFTPHPSLVPIEMAAAGLLVVTNTFDCKGSDEISQISSNIIAVEPSVDCIAEALVQVAREVYNFERRERGSHVNWPLDWSTALDDSVMNAIDGFIRKASER